MVRNAAVAPLRTPESDYAAGRCNIGRAEIARRRRFGHASALVTVGLFAILLLTDAPGWLRLLLFLPAAGAAAGYLQAALHFCADYGWRGVFNLDRPAGHANVQSVADAEARRADRRMAVFIGLSSAALGALVGLIALLV